MVNVPSGNAVQEFFMAGDVAAAAIREGVSMTPKGIVAAADRGDLRVAATTPTGRRLFAREDVLAFIRTRREGGRQRFSNPASRQS
jgi:hypothetical protein